MITTLNILLKFVWLDDGYFEINSTKFNDVIHLKVMQLIFRLKTFKNIVNATLVTHY